MVKTENWGRRKLAYRIGKHREGTYVLEVFNGTGELTKELDRRLKVSDLIIRHLVVRVDEELRVAERSRSRRQASAQKHADRHPAAPRPDADGDDDDVDEAEV
jgi:small subunit ribosomal protein S6